MKSLTVEYFAILREQRGVARELVETAAATAKDLYEELHRRHQFTLTPERLRVVLNEEFVPWDAPLNPGDTIVFIPPVAGG